MPQSPDRYWLVCYDISDRKRLSAVHRYLKKTGIAVQYSVFMVQADLSRMKAHMSQLDSLIDSSQDDVRAYPFSSQSWHVCLGQSPLPEGLFFAQPPLALAA